MEQRVSAVEEKNKQQNKLAEMENKMEAQAQLEKDKLAEMEKKMSVEKTGNNKAVEMQKKMEVSLLAEKNKAIEMEKNFNKSVVALEVNIYIFRQTFSLGKHLPWIFKKL